MTRTFRYIAVLGWLAGAGACSGNAGTTQASPPAIDKPAAPAGPALSVEPKSALVDVPLALRMSGLQPGAHVTLHASAYIYGTLWNSAAEFVADDKGAIDVTRQAPISGSYAVADAMGLVWSMMPPDKDKSWQSSFARNLTLAPSKLSFVAEMAGKTVASADVTRLAVSTRVERHEIRPGDKDGPIGTLFVPHGGKPRPGVIMLGGSEGGLFERNGAILASHGYTVLVLAYFAHEGLPRSLYRLPLEYFGKAIAFLKSHPLVDASHLAVMGISRGGELALLLGASFPDIKAVIAMVPSGVMWPGLDLTAAPDSSWTLAGKPLPYVPYKNDPALQAAWAARMQKGEAIEAAPLFLAAMKDTKAMARAEIAVEKIQGPVLLISGKADAIWPSTELAEVAVKRLQKNQHPHPFEHVAYDDAGHLIVPPYRPTIAALPHPQTGAILAFGGTPQGNAHACADSWQRILDFLERASGGK